LNPIAGSLKKTTIVIKMKSGIFGKTKLKIEMEIEILGENSLFMAIYKILPFTRHP